MTASTPDPDAIVAKHWPLDRRSHDHLRTAIATAADLVRYANHVTYPDDASTTLKYAGELYAVTGALSGLMDGLPQLLRQLAGRADALAADQTLRHTSGGDPAVAMAEAADALGKADKFIGKPNGWVRDARNKLTWVGHG